MDPEPSVAESKDATHDTLMWEVVAAAGNLPALLQWIDEVAVPSLRSAPQFHSVDVYTAADDRAVLIVRFTGTPVQVPEPPDELLNRPAHQWPFQHRWSLPTT